MTEHPKPAKNRDSLSLIISGCVVEATIVAMLAWIVLDFTISWAYMFGFIICAISPAIIVPTMLKIQTEGYGK